MSFFTTSTNLNKNQFSSLYYSDRFIPSSRMKSTSLGVQTYGLQSDRKVDNQDRLLNSAIPELPYTTASVDYCAQGIFNVSREELVTKARVLKFNKETPKITSELESLKTSFESLSEVLLPLKKKRQLPKAAVKVLELPDFEDDFYVNLLAWSADNTLAVGLKSNFYLVKGCNNQGPFSIKQTDEDINVITSLAFSSNSHLFVGTSLGAVIIFDLSEASPKILSKHSFHSERVLGLSLYNESSFLNGTKEGKISLTDWRVAKKVVRVWDHHKMEVLRIAYNGGFKIATGGNDNLFALLDVRGTSPAEIVSEHNAAVKALDFIDSTHLVSGGGTADKKLKVWDVGGSPKLISELNMNAQVISVLYSASRKILTVTRGFAENDLVFFDMPSATTDLEQTSISFDRSSAKRRVCAAISPDGARLATASADECLRFYDLAKDQRRVSEKAVYDRPKDQQLVLAKAEQESTVTIGPKTKAGKQTPKLSKILLMR